MEIHPSGISRPRPAIPCFRPSNEYVPPRLCRTYTWQEGEAVPEVPSRGNSTTALLVVGEERDGWDCSFVKEKDVVVVE